MRPSSRSYSRPAASRQQRGVALIIVLAFVVLLTAVVVAFFSRAMSERQISSASSGQVKVDMLAEGAMNNILGDLKEEISAGSIVTTGSIVGTGSTYTYCVPASPWAAIPCASGTAGANWLPPNVLKRSAYNQPFYSGTNYTGANNYVFTTVSGTTVNSSTSTLTYVPPNRAAQVSSTVPALNGRYISMPRWNKPFLMPAASGTDATPLAGGSIAVTGSSVPWAYAPPDWVLVDRAGNNPRTWSGALQWTASNSTTVVGRYAYNIYDEGGLLDMNVAGYPYNSGSNPTVSAVDIGSKRTTAMADLTQLPVDSSGDTLSATQAAAIINWRNQYTLQSGNNSASYTGSNNAYVDMVMNTNTTGHMQVNGGNGQTDQAFLSRQALMNFLLSGTVPGLTTAQAQYVMQYMGTFSRSLEQPSFAPNPSRPRIMGTASQWPPVNADSYAGNNDAVGGDDIINPAFLSVRVSGTFKRLDGTAAVIGEPLVKKRFALSRLGLVTYSSTANNIQGDPIYDRFGIYRGNPSQPWTYDHGSSTSPSKPHIMTLAEVAAANREPDFVELLKAAICAGSLAKGGPNLHPDTNSSAYDDNNYQYYIDTALDYNILQIMANLIDQYDTDSYPTVIQIAAGSYYRTFRGVEDLPYFYRFQQLAVTTQLPQPLLSKTQTVTFSIGSTLSSPYGSATVTGTAGNATIGSMVASVRGPTVTGSAALVYVPEVWNPHSKDTVLSSGSNRPQTFRITATTQDPVGLTSQWQSGVDTTPSTTGSGSFSPMMFAEPTSKLVGLGASNAEITFQDGNGAFFREPTLLWRSNYPQIGANTVSLSSTTNMAVVDINTSKTYYGIVLGQAPLATTVTLLTGSSSSGAPGQLYILENMNAIQPTTFNSVGSEEMFTFRLQYQDPNNSSNWITYDEKYVDRHGLDSPGLVVNTNDFSNNSWMNPLRNNQLYPETASCHDPRSARFGFGMNATLAETSINGFSFSSFANGYILEPTVMANFNANTATGNQNVGKTNFTTIETDRPRTDLGNKISYSNPCMTSDPGKSQQMHWYSGVGFSASNGSNASPLQFDGMLSQNNSAIAFFSRNGSAPAQLFYEDADGVDRRSMGAYASTNLSGTNAVGMPEALADTVADGGAPMTPLSNGQTQSRPIVLNRPFRNVGEMAYAMRGVAWKNIDFFTPESGDAALLDVFCIDEPASNAMAAGKVNLNTRQAPVLQAVLSGAYRDEFANLSGTASYMLPSLSVTEASNIALKQISRTMDSVSWRGPLTNISELVGKFVGVGTLSGTGPDLYTYTQGLPPNQTYNYSGLSAALDSTVYTDGYSPYIQRMRETAIRALAESGQARVWNLLIDVVAQSGRYPSSASNLGQFQVEGEKRYWVHVAIDRYTGAIVDKQIEVVTE